MIKYSLFHWLFDMSYHALRTADTLLGKEHGISEAVLAWHEHRREVYYAHLKKISCWYL